MDRKSVVNAFLAEAGKQLGVEDLSLDERGICILSGDSNTQFVVEAPANADLVYFYATVAEVPSESKETFFEKLLTMNLYGLRTDESTLALDPKYNVVVLYYSAYIETLDFVRFYNALVHFIEAAKRIKEELKEQQDISGDNTFQYPQMQV